MASKYWTIYRVCILREGNVQEGGKLSKIETFVSEFC